MLIRHIRLEAADYLLEREKTVVEYRKTGPSRCFHHQRQPNVRRFIHLDPAKLPGGDANNRELGVVEANLPPQDIGIGTELALPGSVAEDRYGMGVRYSSFVRQKIST